MSNKIYFDGSKKENIITFGYVIFDHESDKVIFEEKFSLTHPILTSNVAEYMGLTLALLRAKSEKLDDIVVYGDSLMVINHMVGIGKIKYPISKLLHLIASEIAYRIPKTKFIWIPRKENLADRAIK